MPQRFPNLRIRHKWWGGPPGPRGSPWTRFSGTESAASARSKPTGAPAADVGVRPTIYAVVRRLELCGIALTIAVRCRHRTPNRERASGRRSKAGLRYHVAPAVIGVADAAAAGGAPRFTTGLEARLAGLRRSVQSQNVQATQCSQDGQFCSDFFHAWLSLVGGTAAVGANLTSSAAAAGAGGTATRSEFGCDRPGIRAQPGEIQAGQNG